MSLMSALASAVYAWLPQQLRFPSPRKSEAAREFDALMLELCRNEALAGDSFGRVTEGVACEPPMGAERARKRRARN